MLLIFDDCDAADAAGFVFGCESGTLRWFCFGDRFPVALLSVDDKSFGLKSGQTWTTVAMVCTTASTAINLVSLSITFDCLLDTSICCLMVS